MREMVHGSADTSRCHVCPSQVAVPVDLCRPLRRRPLAKHLLSGISDRPYVVDRINRTSATTRRTEAVREHAAMRSLVPDETAATSTTRNGSARGVALVCATAIAVTVVFLLLSPAYGIT